MIVYDFQNIVKIRGFVICELVDASSILLYLLGIISVALLYIFRNSTLRLFDIIKEVNKFVSLKTNQRYVNRKCHGVIAEEGAQSISPANILISNKIVILLGTNHDKPKNINQ